VKFGVFDHLDRNDLPLADFYEQRLEFTDLYDRLGFYSYHLAEHHGTPLGMASSPSVFLAAVAKRTQRLRFGPMVYLLPLYHPIRLAEEISMLDQLGRGRLDVGVGRGRSPVELESFGIEPASAESVYNESLEILTRVLSDGTVTFAGNHYTMNDVRIQMRALQKPHPPFWYGIGSPSGIDRYVAGNFNVLSIMKPGPAGEIIRRYLDTAAAAGKDLLAGVCRFAVVADTTGEALKIARRAYPYWHKSFDYLFALHGIRPVQAWPGDFDAMAADELAFAGSPDDMAEMLRSHLDRTGANYFAGQFVFGDITADEGRHSIELFSKSVIPALQGALTST
jgi:alkanesulfonate monooxygenase SsuD/methylene tetrahydromethanopterin reductase-like flavin-dependent oxidoreductase (luciferase family)